MISFATWWWGAVQIIQETRCDEDISPSFCSIDHPAGDKHLWDIRPCRRYARTSSGCKRPSVLIPPRSFEPASLMLLLLHTEDDTSPQRLPHYLSLHVKHPSSERLTRRPRGCFIGLKYTLVSFFSPAKEPHRNPHLVQKCLGKNSWNFHRREPSSRVCLCRVASCLQIYLLRNGLRIDGSSPGTHQLT